MLAAVEPDASPRTLDEGGDLILLKDDYRGLLVTVGFPAFVTPAWSPDGKWIAYQRRDRGVTQLWRVAANGGKAEPVTQSAVDIQAFAWLSNDRIRSEEHTSELQSLMRISYAVFCLKKKKTTTQHTKQNARDATT